MQRIDRKRLLAAFALAATLGACSNDIGLNDLDPSRKFASMTRPGWLTFSGHADDLTLPAVTERDLINQAGQCAAPAATSDALTQAGISLQMTECEVVNRAGAPDNIEFGNGDGAGRMVSLTYLGGPRPGVYRFATGRLYSIERAPNAPQQQQRPPAKKSNRA